MHREVRYDGAGTFQIRFSFDRRLVELIKTLPTRRWNAAERYWSVLEQHVVELVELLLPEEFRFDAATRDFYRVSGGTRTLEELPCEPVPAPRLPGLFDDPAPVAGDFTVSRLNRSVQEVLEQAFPLPLWLVGEISGFNRNAHKRHVSFQLVEKQEEGQTLSSVDATLFEVTRRSIERALGQAGNPFHLEDEITVRMRVRIELYIPWGSYRVVVDELDVHYTLGEAARRREEIVRRLTEAGLTDRNVSIPIPALPLRVGLVTSLGSDAYEDVLRTLQESGFAFRVLAHGVRVQGHATEPSVLNALNALRRSAAELDVVIVCRGGGSRTDLAWFDTEPLGRAVATFPLPILVGIGHEQDHSVLDAVARRFKTPTAAAAFVVQTVRESLEAIEETGRNVLALTARQLREERRRSFERGRRLALGARGLLARERVELGHRASRAGRSALAHLATAADRLARAARGIPRASSVHLAHQHGALAAQARALGPRATRIVTRETERTASRSRRLHLLHPRRVLERGYALLRTADGGVLTTADRAPSGSLVVAELRRGSLRLRSEGGPLDQGGDG